jgi:hypothetical protein
MEAWLVSDETGGQFSHCISCQLPLAEIAAPYLVNKEFHRGECVLEYAICQPCRDGVTELLSEDSKETVRQFLETEIDWEARVREFMLNPDATGRFDDCIACGKVRRELEGFGISALCDSGGALVHGPLPLLICSECIRKMTHSLSEGSREVWRKFLAAHFVGPPDGSGFPGLL